MQRKNVILIASVFLALVIFLLPEIFSAFPGWPGYGVSSFIRWNDPILALTHARVIDGTGAAPIEDVTLIIAAGKIWAIGSAAGTVVPPGAKVLDLAGYTIIPGLVGMHDHMFYPSGNSGGYKEMGFSFPRLYLASGVTTIRTAGGILPAADLKLKSQIDRGWLAGPKMHVSGPYFDGGLSPDQVRKLVNVWADKGATSFKAYMYLSHSALAAAIDEAHKRGLKLTGHLCAVGFREAAALGIDNLEHGLVVDTEFDPGKKPDVCPDRTEAEITLYRLDLSSAPVREMIQDLVTHHIAVTSTLPVFETYVPFRSPADARILDAMEPSARLDYLDARARINLQTRSPWPQLLKKEMQFERDFIRAGGLLLAGEDPTGNGGDLAGFGDQREIELLVEAGFTPIEAIHIATANGAEFLGESDHIGSITVGKEADLVVIKGDPSARIADIENVEIVFKDGIGYDSAKLIASVRGNVGSR